MLACRRCALEHILGTPASMFGVQRFDPLKQSDHTDVAEAVGGGFSQKLLLAREQAAAAAAAEKRFGHLSGAQRRARAKAKAEGREYVPTVRAADAAPRAAKVAVAEETKDAATAHSVDPVRRGDKKRRVQDRLDDGNAVYKRTAHRSDSTDDSSDAEEKGPVKRRKDAGDAAIATEDLHSGAEADGAAPEADEEQLEKERRRRKKKKDKKKKKKAAEKNEERKRQRKAAVGEDPDADSDDERKKPRKPKSERTNKMHELVRARAAAAQMRHGDESEIHGPLGQDEQDALDEEASLVAEADALQAADKNAPALSLDELQSRLTEATTTRPTAQYLNDQQQVTNADDGIDADAAGLPSWLARAQRVVLPNDDEQEQQGASGDILPTGPTLDEAGVGVDGSLSLAAQERLGVVRLWPAQAAAIPAILSHRGDVLLSAPTGSGKTLVYTLPILHALASRVAIRLRAVVVLPTRDLAMQVHSVFETLIDGGSLDVNLVAACGTEKMAEESARLCPGMADVVVGTPGRIVAHMRETEGFEHQLSTVEWLVIDDADRLLQQSHQDWLPRLMAAVERKPGLAEQSKLADFHADSEAKIVQTSNSDLAAYAEEKCNHLPSNLSLCDYVVMSDPQVVDAEAALGWRRGVRKLILSATLTRHPAKLHSLRLHRPLHLHAATADDMTGSNKRFSLPITLSERCAVVPPGGKPLALVLELQAHFSSGDRAGAGGVIVFAATVETSHRLARVLQLYGGVAVSEYSARLRPEERRASLKRLANGTTQVLVCSDVLSRGIDVSGVTLVVNYDAPSHPKTYIHRVGRTARAGRRGTAITLLLREEVRFFSQLRKKAGLRTIKPAAIAAYRAVVAHNASAAARCTACLGELETVLAHESMQLLQSTADVEALPPNAGLDAMTQSGTDQTDDMVEEEVDGDGAQKHVKTNATPAQQIVRSGAETGAWGRQLVELQRAQLVRHLQLVAR